MIGYVWKNYISEIVAIDLRSKIFLFSILRPSSFKNYIKSSKVGVGVVFGVASKLSGQSVPSCGQLGGRPGDDLQ